VEDPGSKIERSGSEPAIKGEKMSKQEIIVDETSDRFRAFLHVNQWNDEVSKYEKGELPDNVIEFRKYLMTFYPGLTNFKQFHEDLNQLHDETISYPGIFRETDGSLSAHIIIYSYSRKDGYRATIDYCRKNIELTQECVDLVHSEIREHIKNARVLIDTNSNDKKREFCDGVYRSDRDIDHANIDVIERWITSPATK
jgi:hypothetical protein